MPADQSSAHHPVIAIDGPAAAGKTTVGRLLADRLGWTFLDTGVLYRALAWLAAQRDISPTDEGRLTEMARGLDVRVQRPTVDDGRDADVYLGAQDITWAIREPAVDRVVSVIAALPTVRAELVPMQRRAAADGPAIVVGRDIGTMIFPAAPLKVYLSASLEERARRRVVEITAQGTTNDRASVLADLQRRDTLDRGRAYAPLTMAVDAVEVSTDNRNPDDVVDAILALWRAQRPT